MPHMWPINFTKVQKQVSVEMGAFPASIACSPSTASKTQPWKRRREKVCHQNEELLLYKRFCLKHWKGRLQAGREYLLATPSQGNVPSKYKVVLKLSWEKTNRTIKMGQKTRTPFSKRITEVAEKRFNGEKLFHLANRTERTRNAYQTSHLMWILPPNWPKYVWHKNHSFTK